MAAEYSSQKVLAISCFSLELLPTPHGYNQVHVTDLGKRKSSGRPVPLRGNFIMFCPAGRSLIV